MADQPASAKNGGMANIRKASYSVVAQSGDRSLLT
jgi:hypothetical protein